MLERQRKGIAKAKAVGKYVTAQVPPLGHSPRGNFDACGRVCSYPSAFSDPNSLTDPICSGYLGSDENTKNGGSYWVPGW